MLNKYDELEKIVNLKERGVLTEEEFKIEKERILKNSIIDDLNKSKNINSKNTIDNEYDSPGVSNLIVNSLLNNKDISDNISNEDINSGMSRFTFNLLLFFVIIPLIIMGNIGGFKLEDLSTIGLISLLIISAFRFKNIKMSGWFILGLLVPIWGLYLLYLLIFRKGYDS